MPIRRPVVMVFGRFNPPTTGHEALIRFVQSIAHRVNGDVRVYPSQTQDARKNPLPFHNKVRFLQKFFPGVTISDNAGVRTPIDALAEVSTLGYTHVILVAGSDRVRDFEKLGAYLIPRNSPKYDASKHIAIERYQVVAVPGNRDPDAEDVTGMSASKMRAFAKDNNLDAFMQGVPSHVSRSVARDLFKQVRQYMGLHEMFNLTTTSFTLGLFESLTESKFRVGDHVSTSLGRGVITRTLSNNEYVVNIGPLKGREHHGDRTIRVPEKQLNLVKESISEDHVKEAETPGATKPPTEVDRIRSTQQQELIALKQRQANQMMAAKLRDVQMKAREAQMKSTQPKPAAKPAS